MKSYEETLREEVIQHLKGMKIPEEVLSVPSVLRETGKEICDMLYLLQAKEI
jgi:hypothetical protein